MFETSPATQKTSSAAQWSGAAFMVLLSAIPVAVGFYLLLELASGQIRPET